MSRRTLDFDTKLLQLVTNLKAQGKKDQEIASILGVSQETFSRYKHQQQILKDALDKGKDLANDLVERALFARATGYDYIDGGEEKHAPPDINAIKFWLKNKKPSEWKERQDVSHEGKLSLHAMIVKGLAQDDTDEESELEDGESL